MKFHELMIIIINPFETIFAIIIMTKTSFTTSAHSFVAQTQQVIHNFIVHPIIGAMKRELFRIHNQVTNEH